VSFGALTGAIFAGSANSITFSINPSSLELKVEGEITTLSHEIGSVNVAALIYEGIVGVTVMLDATRRSYLYRAVVATTIHDICGAYRKLLLYMTDSTKLQWTCDSCSSVQQGRDRDFASGVMKELLDSILVPTLSTPRVYSYQIRHLVYLTEKSPARVTKTCSRPPRAWIIGLLRVTAL